MEEKQKKKRQQAGILQANEDSRPRSSRPKHDDDAPLMTDKTNRNNARSYGKSKNGCWLG